LKTGHLRRSYNKILQTIEKDLQSGDTPLCTPVETCETELLNAVYDPTYVNIVNSQTLKPGNRRFL